MAATPDLDVLRQHREILAARPELRSVYEEWFGHLLECVRGLRPIIEIGGGPGLFKQYCPRLISTDLLVSQWVDVACNAEVLPFRSSSIGALVLVDALHHMARPLEFIGEVRRVLQPQGRLAMVEPWITPLSFILYRVFHHEDCRLQIDLARPFEDGRKGAFDGNAAIPFLLVRHLGREAPWLRLVKAQPFLALPYLASLGFKSSRPVPSALIGWARACERALGPLRRLAATRVLVVWQKVS
jgi:SAM-dependent methyltransferase